MKINVTCEKHNVSMVVVREWTQNGGIELTVEPCPECMEEAVIQKRACPQCGFVHSDSYCPNCSFGYS